MTAPPRPRLRRRFGRALTAVTAVVLSCGVASPAVASVIGPDVSSFQHPSGYSINWSAAHATSGAAFAFVKATEGTSYTNKYFAPDYAALRSAGMMRGAYHYAQPAAGTASAIAQADHFLAATGTSFGAGDLPPVLDLEANNGLTPSALSAWAAAYLQRIRARTGRTPILYTAPAFWRAKMANTTAFSGYPLWVANYAATAPAMFGGWKAYTFWQYTDSGKIAGMAGAVDVSVFNGTLTQLRALAGNSTPAPVPTPTPAPTLLTPQALSATLVKYYGTPLAQGVAGQPVNAVKAVQQLVQVTNDGDFGPHTAAAVTAWQSQHHLTGNGIVDLPTWKAMLTAVGAPIPTPPAPTPTPTPAPTPAPRPVPAPVRPSAPVSVRASASGGRLTLTWAPPASGQASAYSVSLDHGPARPLPGNARAFTTAATGALTHTLRLLASNPAGSSPAVDTAVFVPAPVALSAAPSASAVALGSSTVVTLRAARADTKAVLPRTRVTVSIRPHGGARWSATAVTTDAHGLVRITLKPAVTTDVVITTAATRTLEAGVGRTTLAVRPPLTARLAATVVPRNRSVALTGATTPALRGQRVWLQLYTRGAWRSWAFATVATSGRYNFTVWPQGTASAWRVWSPASAVFAESASPGVVARVR